jgi:hypothetical protein
LEQLRTVEASKASLESAIAAADSRAYQQSAEPLPTMSNQMTMTQLVPNARWLLTAGLGAIAILIGGLAVYFVRRT